MGRRTTNQELRDVIAKLRKEIPDIVLRTTLITGFPGETQKDHEILMNFVDEMEFERLGVFTYSKEEGTPAEKMENQIPEEVKEERRDEIMELQQEIAFDFSEKMIGKVMKAYIEGKISGENAYIARTYMDIPGVDSNVFVITDEELMTGDFVNVLITGSNLFLHRSRHLIQRVLKHLKHALGLNLLHVQHDRPRAQLLLCLLDGLFLCLALIFVNGHLYCHHPY